MKRTALEKVLKDTLLRSRKPTREETSFPHAQHKQDVSLPRSEDTEIHLYRNLRVARREEDLRSYTSPTLSTCRYRHKTRRIYTEDRTSAILKKTGYEKSRNRLRGTISKRRLIFFEQSKETDKSSAPAKDTESE